jgi:hypothetical protein
MVYQKSIAVMGEDISCAICLVVGVERLEEVVYRFVEDRRHYSLLLYGTYCPCRKWTTSLAALLSLRSSFSSLL